MTDGRDAAEEARVTVVYCGGCNPHIDRRAVAAALPVNDPGVRPGTVVHLSGCPRACASDHMLGGRTHGRHAPDELARDEGRSVIVAGELVDGVPTPGPDIAGAVTRKLKE